MKRINSQGIVLRRTNYGEADRIINFFTPTNGKVAVMARGVRKPKSKLAGGIELFSVCSISFIQGRGEVCTLTSSRMDQHFDEIVKNYDATQTAYMALKMINSFTDSEAGEEYFLLIENTLSMLNQHPKKYQVIGCWFMMQLMKMQGSAPNTTDELSGAALKEEGVYRFSVEDGGFFSSEAGNFSGTDIKAWRVFLQASTRQIVNISGLSKSARDSVTVLEEFVEFQS